MGKVSYINHVLKHERKKYAGKGTVVRFPDRHFERTLLKLQEEGYVSDEGIKEVYRLLREEAEANFDFRPFNMEDEQ